MEVVMEIVINCYISEENGSKTLQAGECAFPLNSNPPRKNILCIVCLSRKLISTQSTNDCNVFNR